MNFNRGGKRKPRLFSGEFMREAVTLAEAPGVSVPQVLGYPRWSDMV
ncbi:hypothetical protein PQR57_35320 [Paraburkholderia dipogonis]|uniref:Transposase n=1 Tax=Paraburkholderia dipogonis TaxID=1211383 RepID=A0ABW9B1R0_9BURK